MFSDFLRGIANSYASFFSWDQLVAAVTDPVSLGIIGSLIILEGLLSSDNALVLAVVVKQLPKHQQKKALMYGIWGAYLFRFIAIGLGLYLVQLRWVKILGALYLLWMSLQYFFFNAKEEDNGEIQASTSFWGTVVKVELMDIAFSIDSVLAAFGVSEKVWVLFLGAIFGILMMRGVAQIFLKLIDKFPELETGAYVLIGIIGLKMAGSVFGLHMSDALFFGILVFVFACTFAFHYIKKGLQKGKTEDDEKKVS